MKPPVFYLISGLWPLLLPPVVLSVLAHVAKDQTGFALPTPVVVVLCILSIPATFVTVNFIVMRAQMQRAAKFGSALPPQWEGKWIGNLDVLIRFLKAWKEGYIGDRHLDGVTKLGSVLGHRFMGDYATFTTEPEHIKIILATDFNNYIKGKRFRVAMESVLGSGVFNSDGDMWKFHRGMTRPFFARDRISHFAIFDRHAEDLVAKLKERLRGGYPVDFQDAISRFTLDSATEFLFGACVNSLSAGLPYPGDAYAGHAKASDDPAEKFARAFAEAQYVVAGRSNTGDAWPMFELAGDRSKRPMAVVNAFIEPVVNRVLAKHQQMKAEREAASHSSKEEIEDHDTLLDYLVRQTSDVSVLKDETLNMLVAGRDTTAGLLTFTAYFLAMYPNVMARLREEVLLTVGASAQPTFDNIKNMKYLRAVLNETLRLYPLVPWNVRESVHDTTWPSPHPDGKPIFIPGGTSVIYSVFMMQRRKDLWGPDAEEFDPERFLDERVKKYLIPNPMIFAPFNAGPRICLGQQFAYNEASFVLIRLLQQFSAFHLATEYQPRETHPPADWASCEGRKGIEQIFPRSHLTAYSYGGLWLTMTEADD
ncbi:cytochrome P450 [Fomitopsis serialis]|uniref:cytochrome P450 n=1 Tax=Fomitopsis serialis TaxID=139415 RepID=UPI002008B03B|nr:cytochrome P450 [Neoantrodia serialis]KAH9914218.1 cytochrome P450 [Neoantrodia serialis]